MGRPLFIDPRRRPTTNPLPRPSKRGFPNRFRSAPRRHTASAFISRYIQHRFRLHFYFPVFVFRPKAPQHVHLILQAGREKYAYSGDSGGSDHYYIGIGNGGSGGGGGCSKNIVIIIT